MSQSNEQGEEKKDRDEAKLVVIADDLTGANDTAVQFAKRGIKSCVLLDSAVQMALPAAKVVVFDTDSRAAKPREAYAKVSKVCKIVQKSNVSLVYKKIDSTLRGNLGAEIEATADVFQPEIIVIAPAFPRNHRITVGGYHLLNQLPVSETELARDPKTPVKESRLPELLRQQTKNKIGYIPLYAVMAGVASIQENIAERLLAGEKWLVFDAVSDANLRLIATVAAAYKRILWAGSAGLAEALGELYDWESTVSPDNSPVQGPVLLVAGSLSQITHDQVAAVLRQPATRLVTVNVPELLNNPEKEIAKCVSLAKEILTSKNNIVIVSSSDDGAMDGNYDLRDNDISDRIVAGLGMITAKLAELEIAGLVLTGGDTAVSVCRALGANGLEIVDEVAIGIPIGRLSGGQFAGMKVVTKAGAFGDELALVTAMRSITGNVEAK